MCSGLRDSERQQPTVKQSRDVWGCLGFCCCLRRQYRNTCRSYFTKDNSWRSIRPFWAGIAAIEFAQRFSTEFVYVCVKWFRFIRILHWGGWSCESCDDSFHLLEAGGIMDCAKHSMLLSSIRLVLSESSRSIPSDKIRKLDPTRLFQLVFMFVSLCIHVASSVAVVLLCNRVEQSLWSPQKNITQ